MVNEVDGQHGDEAAEQPVNPRAYIGAFWITFLLGLGFRPFLAHVGLVPGLFLGPLVVFVLFLRKVWSTLPGKKHPRPDETFLLLVPFLNLVWQYRVIYPLGRTLLNEVGKKELTGVEVGDAVSRVFCHLLWALVLVMFLGYQFIPAASGPLVVLTLALVFMMGLLLILANVMMWNYGQVVNAIAKGRDRSNGIRLSAQSEGVEKQEPEQTG